MRRHWRRFRSNRVALVIVVVIGAFAGVATSDPYESISVPGGSGVFVLTPDEPSAEIVFDFAASDTALSEGGASVRFEAHESVLSPDSGEGAIATLDNREIQRGRYSRIMAFCGADCLGSHSLRFELPLGSPNVVIRWSMTANAAFDSGAVPDSATMDLDVTATGPLTPVSVLDHRLTGGASEWFDVTVVANTDVAIAEAAQLWVALPVTSQTAIVNLGEDQSVVLGGGAALVQVPDECHVGPCVISTDFITSPLSGHTMLLVGQADVSSNVELVSRSSRLQAGKTTEPITLARGERRDFDMYVEISGVAPEIASALPMHVELSVSDPSDGDDHTWAEFQFLDLGISGFQTRSARAGSTLECTGAVCSGTYRFSVRNPTRDSVEVAVTASAHVMYGRLAEVDVEIQP